jgi:hypothetical protein
VTGLANKGAHRTMSRNDWFLLASIPSSLAAIVLVVFAGRNTFGTAAEWFSGLASAAAVFAAIYVARQALTAEQRKDMARGQALALRLLVPIIVICGDIRRAREFAAEFKHGMDDRINDATAIQNMGIETKFPQGSLEDVWLLPPRVTAALLQLEQLLMNHERMLRERVPLRNLIADTPTYISGIDTSLNSLAFLAEESRTFVAEITARVVGSAKIADIGKGMTEANKVKPS